MKRREFIAATAALLVSPRRSLAQGTRRRVGFLDPFQLPALQGVARQPTRSRLDRGKNLIIDFRFAEGSRIDCRLSHRSGRSQARPARWPEPARSRSPEVGNSYHSDRIRGGRRSRGAWPCAKPAATGWQHNGSGDHGSRRLPRETARNPPGTRPWRLENCALGQSEQPNAQAHTGIFYLALPKAWAWLCQQLKRPQLRNSTSPLPRPLPNTPMLYLILAILSPSSKRLRE